MACAKVVVVPYIRDMVVLVPIQRFFSSKQTTRNNVSIETVDSLSLKYPKQFELKTKKLVIINKFKNKL